MDRIAQAASADRADLFQRTAETGRPVHAPEIIEKDFWVCWTLYRMFDVMRFRPQLIFKGGTSLSKAFHAIERFSEDVDLSLSRKDLGFGEDRDPERVGISKKEAKRRMDALVEECREVIRARLLPELRADFRSILGDKGWSVELDTKDPQTIIFAYPRSESRSALKYISPVVRLEMGARSDDWPADDREISPYAAEAFPKVFTTTPLCRVRVLDARRTFWEKATILHAEYHRPVDKPDKGRLSRHYYDVYRLARQRIGQEALARAELLERVVKHKDFFFPQSWAHYETAVRGSFHLSPPSERSEELRKDYLQMQMMIFGPAPGWDEILDGLADLETQINGRIENRANLTGR